MQGHATPFYARLGRALAAAGHGVTRINICGGDRLFWGGWQARNFRARPTDLPDFTGQVMDEEGATDLIVYNDSRPCNAVAIAEAKRRGLRVHVFEEGYLRPHWLTLERDGVNGNSRLPDDPAWYRDAAAGLPAVEAPSPVGAGLSHRIAYDFAWQFANYAYRPLYPHYRTHRPYPIFAEYATWATRLASLKWRRAQARAAVSALLTSGKRFFLFPLQLDSDSQIRVHSPFARMGTAIGDVMTDFARHAPTDSLLVIKNHPLDNAWVNFRRLVARHAAALEIADRVLFIDGGDLAALIDRAAGTVTVNSTVGFTALERARPVITLGKAVFDVPGLTFQGMLAEFWRDPTPADPALWSDFRLVVRQSCLVEGNFYREDGMRLGVARSVERLLSDRNPLADAPPRRPLPARIVSSSH
jgi:capsular polysaccharide export protein